MSVSIKYKGSEILNVPSGGDYKLNTSGKYLEDDIRITATGGGSATVVVTEEQLPGGGIAKHINAVDISDTTAVASDVAQGKYFYTADGTKTEGTSSGGGGGSTAEKKQVNFIDYDGTILYSYTAEEAQALTALPANPSHSGLIAQGWNWSLANIKSQLTNVGGDVWVGQMYDTESGKTEIDINADNPDFLSPYLAICPNSTCTIDWGDGTATDTVTGTSYTSLKYTPHVYATTGRYTISIDGPMGFYGGSSNYGALLTDKASLSNRKTYTQCVEAIRCANGVYIGSYAFNYCLALQSITIPDSVTSIGGNAFTQCQALRSITIPNGVTSIVDYEFQSCMALRSIIIPNGVTSIEGSAFTQCLTLRSITIPNSVTSIGGNAFNSCYSIMEYHILPTTPPTLANKYAFGGIIENTIIYVPKGSLNAYKTATNWSTYASYMQEEPA